MDFPVILPYLKDGAIVVLHDVCLNQITVGWEQAFATGTLLSAVTSEEKFLNSDSADKPFLYPNIAAFRINEHTRRYIENVFLALMINWYYIPPNKELEIYRDFYEKHYSAHLVTIFNEAIRLNSYRTKRK